MCYRHLSLLKIIYRDRMTYLKRDTRTNDKSKNRIDFGEQLGGIGKGLITKS